MMMTRIRELAPQLLASNLPHICGCPVWIYIHGVSNDGTGGRKKEKIVVSHLTDASDGNHCIGWMNMPVHR